MADSTAKLDPPVMPSTDYSPVTNQDRTDRYPAFGQAELCFFNGRLHKDIHNFTLLEKITEKRGVPLYARSDLVG